MSEESEETTIMSTTMSNERDKITTIKTVPEAITNISDDVTTIMSMLSKDPRFGDNDITEGKMPNDESTTTLKSDDSHETTTDSMEITTISGIVNNTVTKRPATRFDTTLEIEDEQPITSTTETITDFTTYTMETITDDTTDIDLMTTTESIRQNCSSQMDCIANEKCINNECFKMCETNDNVTKISDDCVQGIYHSFRVHKNKTTISHLIFICHKQK